MQTIQRYDLARQCQGAAKRYSALCHAWADGSVLQRLRQGEPVHPETEAEAPPDAARLNLAHYFPCVWRDELIAVLAVGRREGLDPLNSEEVDSLEALAAQAATAFSNGRLFRSLAEKARSCGGSRSTTRTSSRASTPASWCSTSRAVSSGGTAPWRRSRALAAGGRSAGALEDVFPETFLEALRGALVLGDHEEIAHIYKLHLPSADGRSLMVNVSVAPFQAAPGERARHHPHPRRRDRPRAPRGAAAALGEDGLGRAPRRRRRPRGEHTPRRHLLLHPAPAGPAGGRATRASRCSRRSRSRASARRRSSTNLLNFSRSGGTEIERAGRQPGPRSTCSRWWSTSSRAPRSACARELAPRAAARSGATRTGSSRSSST